MFYDRAKIYVKAGRGGDGSASFRRERHIPKGGPDGGDGGKGGSVYLRVNPELNTLLPFHYKQHFSASNGEQGSSNKKHGANGHDLYIDVPPGTQVTIVEEDLYDPELNVTRQIDLVTIGQEVMIARGGKGGLGNTHFTTPTHQAPRIAEKGEPGQERTLQLELKIIADVGLVGYPNAGKSTLLAAVSAARPKIADYPFTTLEPQLGVVDVDDRTFVLADIPGLIEGASEGTGLGLEFLRHVERCRLLIHEIDGASGLFPGLDGAEESGDGRNPLADFETINRELQLYSPELAAKPQIVAINKMDLPETQARWPELRRAFTERGLPVYAISAATGQGVQELMRRVAAELAAQPRPQAQTEVLDEDAPTHTLADNADDNSFTVTQLADDIYRVRGPRIERTVAMTNMESEEALDRLQNVLARSGISAALEAAGVKPGDTVVIGRFELEWRDDPWLTVEGRRAARRSSRHSGPGKQHS